MEGLQGTTNFPLDRKVLHLVMVCEILPVHMVEWPSEAAMVSGAVMGDASLALMALSVALESGARHRLMAYATQVLLTGFIGIPPLATDTTNEMTIFDGIQGCLVTVSECLRKINQDVGIFELINRKR